MGLCFESRIVKRSVLVGCCWVGGDCHVDGLCERCAGEGWLLQGLVR